MCRLGIGRLCEAMDALYRVGWTFVDVRIEHDVLDVLPGYSKRPVATLCYLRRSRSRSRRCSRRSTMCMDVDLWVDELNALHRVGWSSVDDRVGG